MLTSHLLATTKLTHTTNDTGNKEVEKTLWKFLYKAYIIEIEEGNLYDFVHEEFKVMTRADLIENFLAVLFFHFSLAALSGMRIVKGFFLYKKNI